MGIAVPILPRLFRKCFCGNKPSCDTAEVFTEKKMQKFYLHLLRLLSNGWCVLSSGTVPFQSFKNTCFHLKLLCI